MLEKPGNKKNQIKLKSYNYGLVEKMKRTISSNVII